MSNSLIQLTLTRLRLFFREPGTLFWAFGFPLLLSLALGVAFRNHPPDPVPVVVSDTGAMARGAFELLRVRGDLHAELLPPADAAHALTTGKAALMVKFEPDSPIVYAFDQTRPDSFTARLIVDDILQRAAGMQRSRRVREELVTAPGERYIDFLVPGLLGMNIMSSGMWGLGFAIVEMRTRKLLKRMAATPMRRSEFLFSFLLSRLVFLAVELPLMLGFAYFVFGVQVRGSMTLFCALSALGALCFSGVGLLVGARTASNQTAGGLMNLIMMPMFVCSGVFFSASKFPDTMQPLIRVLPLTALTDSLRAVMNEGAGIAAVSRQALILAAFAVVSFGAALRLFRWQ